MPTEDPRLRSLALLPLTAALTVGASSAAQETDRAQCLDTVLPTARELTWQSIPWRTRFGAAALEADDLERPVLLWAMNGHPLGCT
jgi:hypothetical protein